MFGRRMRALAVTAVAALGVGVTLPAALDASADAAGEIYAVHSWKDPGGQLHRIRWDPCTTTTYAVNVRHAGATPAARARALADVKEAMSRAASRTGLTFHFNGVTSEIPRDAGGTGWAERQSAAEIVIAWVDQDHAASRSNLLIPEGTRYSSGTGGWVWKAWTVRGKWQLAIGRGFVVINADDNHLYKGGFGSGYTRGALLLHEVGHALGLDHVGATSQLMFPRMLDRPSAGYHTGDRMGLKKVGEPLGCVPGTADMWKQI